MAFREPPMATRRIRCANFTDDETNALRSLCELLRKYLKEPWCVVSDGDADLVLINLDAEVQPTLPPDTRAVACAMKPRSHRSGTIHRPLRVAEMLAVLSEYAEAPAIVSADSGAEECYMLCGWPLDFEGWPAAWRRVLAMLTHADATPREIAESTGLSATEVGRCLELLDRDGLLERSRHHDAAEVAGGSMWRWHELASRVGHLLGFTL